MDWGSVVTEAPLRGPLLAAVPVQVNLASASSSSTPHFSSVFGGRLHDLPFGVINIAGQTYDEVGECLISLKKSPFLATVHKHLGTLRPITRGSRTNRR